MTGNRQVTRSVATNYKENIIVIVRTLLQGQIGIHFAQGHLFCLRKSFQLPSQLTAPKVKVFSVSLKTHQ